MNRRNFIQISSFFTVNMLLSRLTAFGGDSALVMNVPERILVLTDEGWITCSAAGGNVFNHKDVSVTIKSFSGHLSINLTAPDTDVKELKLVWDHFIGKDALCLGDHWERTYGDLNWHKPETGKREPWYVLIHDQQHTACFGVKTGCNSICAWQFSPSALTLSLDTRSGGGGVRLGNRNLHLADIVTTKSTATESVFQTSRRFCKLMCPVSRLPKQPVYGINDWYYAYGDNSPELILQQTRLMAELVSDSDNRPFSVVDAGWAAYAPKLPGDCCWQDDLAIPNKKFKDMHLLAGQIIAIGMRPGLWTRPLCAKHNDPKNLLLPVISGRNNPLNPVLDPTIADNIERIKHNISTYKQWGFDLVKHDFSTYDITGRWGFQMTDAITDEGWHFADRSITTAEVMKNLYQSIRDAAGDMYLIGCNTVSHLSAGLFEINRIGDDTSGKEWERTRKMGVNTLAFRISQHDIFYAADGDCVGLTNQVPWEKNKQWMQLLAQSSTPLFISAQPNALGVEQKAFIKTCFAQAAKVQTTGEPLDWLSNAFPAKWNLNGTTTQFKW